MQGNANQPGVSIELCDFYVSGAYEKIASLPVLHEMGAGAPPSECIIKRDCSSLECFLDELRGKKCSIFSSQNLKMALYIVLGAVRGKNQSFFAFHLLCVWCK